MRFLHPPVNVYLSKMTHSVIVTDVLPLHTISLVWFGFLGGNKPEAAVVTGTVMNQGELASLTNR